MSEPVTGYPRWSGALARGSRAFVIANEDIRRALREPWTRGAVILGFAYAVLTLGQVYAGAQANPSFHSKPTFLDFLDLLPWIGLGVAALVAGPSLLDDARRGALELYLSRAATPFDWLAGKVLSVVALVFTVVAGPALLYWAASFLLFDTQPDGWAAMGPGLVGYGFLWAVVTGGLGLGLSCISRSGRAATLILFGGVAAMDILLGDLLESITRSGDVQLLSPLASLEQQASWLLGVEGRYTFPAWWGLLLLLGLLAVGWGLVAWKHPRLKGVE